MSPRDDDLAKLAGLCNWAVAYSPTGRYFYRHDGDGIDIPAPDAPLGDQLAFAARIAEELVPTVTIASRLIQQDFVEGVLRKCQPGTDLAWAAVRAAIAAKGGAT